MSPCPKEDGLSRAGQAQDSHSHTKKPPPSPSHGANSTARLLWGAEPEGIRPLTHRRCPEPPWSWAGLGLGLICPPGRATQPGHAKCVPSPFLLPPSLVHPLVFYLLPAQWKCVTSLCSLFSATTQVHVHPWSSSHGSAGSGAPRRMQKPSAEHLSSFRFNSIYSTVLYTEH